MPTVRDRDLGVLVRHTVDDLASMNWTSRIHVVAPASFRVLADPAALERVIANLLINALKSHWQTATSTSGANAPWGAGVLRIVDQGRGIDGRDLSSIFLEFERGRLAQEVTIYSSGSARTWSSAGKRAESSLSGCAGQSMSRQRAAKSATVA
jgi:K+-sensing histidine kinase KdpD